MTMKTFNTAPKIFYVHPPMKKIYLCVFLLPALVLFSACQHLHTSTDAFFMEDSITSDSFADEFPDIPFSVITPADSAKFASLQKEQQALNPWHYDVEGIWCSTETGKPLFATFISRQYRVHHFYDKEAGNLFHRIQACLPQYQVRILRSDNQTNHLLVEATNDRTPATYYSYSVDSNSVSLLHAPAQASYRNRLARTYPITFTARDGQHIEAYLTLPHHQTPEEARNLPVIVLTRSQTHRRHSWEFSPEAQFYASRGCAVVGINARGSSGYGKDFLALSSFHDKDIEDGVAYLQSMGITNPQKTAFHDLDETDSLSIASRTAYCNEKLLSMKQR